MGLGGDDNKEAVAEETATEGGGGGTDAEATLTALKKEYPQLVAVDYTHPSAVLSNMRAYLHTGTDFVMGITVMESHQSSKAGTSDTVITVAETLVGLTGRTSFGVADIVRLRDQSSQRGFGVPEGALDGHAFHTYTLTSPDGSVVVQLQHNVCGRRAYTEDTADTIAFCVEYLLPGRARTG